MIRGPGATLWGANAVNGVINIMTRKAGETQGVLVSGGYGNEEKGFGSFRYGVKLGEDFDLRAYVRYFNRDEFKNLSGGQADDEWDMLRTGFRLDGRLGDSDDITVQGDFYDGTPVSTPSELVDVLLRRPIPLVRTFTENLLAYALGRRVEYYDQPMVREIAGTAEQEGYRMSSFILGVVNSHAFQSKQVETIPTEQATGIGRH